MMNAVEEYGLSEADVSLLLIDRSGGGGADGNFSHCAQDSPSAPSIKN